MHARDAGSTGTPQDIADLCGGPFAATSAPYPTIIQRICDFAQGYSACLLGVTDVWQHAGGKPFSFDLHPSRANCLSFFDLRIPEPNPAGPGSLQCCFGPLGNKSALLLGQGRVQVKHERIDVRPEFGHVKRNPMGQ
jgi:hypothetical protein